MFIVSPAEQPSDVQVIVCVPLQTSPPFGAVTLISLIVALAIPAQAKSTNDNINKFFSIMMGPRRFELRTS